MGWGRNHMLMRVMPDLSSKENKKRHTGPGHASVCFDLAYLTVSHFAGTLSECSCSNMQKSVMHRHRPRETCYSVPCKSRTQWSKPAQTCTNSFTYRSDLCTSLTYLYNQYNQYNQYKCYPCLFLFMHRRVARGSRAG